MLTKLHELKQLSYNNCPNSKRKLNDFIFFVHIFRYIETYAIIFFLNTGGAIWHPRCGPSPDSKIDDDYLDEHKTNGVVDNHVCLALLDYD